MLIYHITTADAWKKSQSSGEYVPEAFEKDGFIHCSKKEQLLTVARRFYYEVRGLVVLEIDSSRLQSKVVEENLDGGTELFPHIYGKIHPKEVLRILNLDWQGDQPLISGL